MRGLFIIVGIFIPAICYLQPKTRQLIMPLPQGYILPKRSISDESLLSTISGSRWEVFSSGSSILSYTTYEGKEAKEILPTHEAYYVTNQVGDFLHLYSDSTQLESCYLSTSAQDHGWVRMSDMLLWRSSLVDPELKSPRKVIVISLRDSYSFLADGPAKLKGVVVFEDPNLRTPTMFRTEPGSIYFIYKESADAFCIGKRSWIPVDTDPGEVLLGWIPKEWCYELASCVWITPNDSIHALQEMKQKNAIPVLLADRTQARKFMMASTADPRFVIWRFNQEEAAPFNDCFPLIEEKDGILAAKLIENQVKTGYTPINIYGLSPPIFKKVVLLDIYDLHRIISNGNAFLSSVLGSNLRDVMKQSLIALYIENYGDISESVFGELSANIVTDRLFFLSKQVIWKGNPSLNDILAPEIVTDNDLKELIARIQRVTAALRIIENNQDLDPEKSFISNSTRYYWIDIHAFI